ncbi:helix-turn-helix domain-containing protein [Sphaerisporangium aureirubrum]|uniref:Helix-turn-helix domain-containing protein n=1 Tax=Sphaerisporangium aureirubrum TaxID=1544736 RepID=A0ABW1NDU5_9ACTN
MTVRADDAEPAFPASLAALRRSAGMTQEQLADAAGLSSRTVGNLERGRVTPHRLTVRRLVAALGPEAASLLASFTEAGGGAAVLGLPPDTEPFTGRDGELATLGEMADTAMTADGRSVGPAVVVICGPAGAGKTRLAIRAAHRVVAAHGAQGLLLDLRGRNRLAIAPGTALGHLMRALGVPESRVPWPVLERTNLLRAVMTGRRGVLVLDDAVAEDQVRPLLPTSAGWLVIVTSRSGLAGLFGARWCPLDPLPGDAPPASGAVLDETYHRLRPEARRLFRRLALLPPGDHPVTVAADIAGLGPADAETAVDALIEAGLLADAPRPGWFRLHPASHRHATRRLRLAEGSAITGRPPRGH